MTWKDYEKSMIRLIAAQRQYAKLLDRIQYSLDTEKDHTEAVSLELINTLYEQAKQTKLLIEECKDSISTAYYVLKLSSDPEDLIYLNRFIQRKTYKDIETEYNFSESKIKRNVIKIRKEREKIAKA